MKAYEYIISNHNMTRSLHVRMHCYKKYYYQKENSHLYSGKLFSMSPWQLSSISCEYQQNQVYLGLLTTTNQKERLVLCQVNLLKVYIYIQLIKMRETNDKLILPFDQLKVIKQKQDLSIVFHVTVIFIREDLGYCSSFTYIQAFLSMPRHICPKTCLVSSFLNVYLYKCEKSM